MANEQVTKKVNPTTVFNCYEVLHALSSKGFMDFTDGKYINDRNDDVGYEEAQKHQADYLLDEVKCRKGSRVLDIGCGYGRVIRQAQERGAKATGITISLPQVEYCRKAGLDVRLLNYKDIPHEWDGKFDCIVANGSIEHFVHGDTYGTPRADEVYGNMFAICHRLLKPGGRFATTVIHFREPPDVEQLLKGPKAQKRKFRMANLATRRIFWGFLPLWRPARKMRKTVF